MADKVITSEVFVAYSQCPRKAFLFLFSDDQGSPHDYPRILEERRKAHQAQYLEAFKQTHEDAKPYDEKNWRKGEVFVEATLRAECWEADCDVLTKVDQGASSRKVMYEPTIVVGTYSLTKEQKNELAFIGKVLGQIQKQLPAVGTIVGMDDKAHRVKLDSGYKAIAPFLKTLQTWIEEKPAEPPTLILNKHCPSCQFRDLCREQAVKENNLSLLDRMTPKAIQKYNKKGIFTVQQLSYLFKPRRDRKRKTKSPVKHNLELQALAIREQKVYVQELPKLTTKPIELFLDLEGIPDQNLYYLMGLLTCEGENYSYHCFWADTANDEEKIWRQLIEKLNEYPGIPIYHYGSYETKAFNELASRYSVDCEQAEKRLINVNSQIYGKVYFPVLSNSLKVIATFLGASWTSLDASGLRSLVWRHDWEKDSGQTFQQELSTYNMEDCLGLKRITDALVKISTNDTRELSTEIQFANEVKVESGYKFGKNKYVFEDLEFINKCAYFNYQREKIYFRSNRKKRRKQSVEGDAAESKKYRINKAVEISRFLECHRCGGHKLEQKATSQKIVLNLKFFSGGVKRWVVKYSAEMLRCRSCNYASLPIEFRNIKSKYGHELDAWIVYQHIALRQSYNRIQEGLQKVFDLHINQSAMDRAKEQLAKFYKITHENILEKLRSGNLIHADETHVNIKGVKAYVWVFTSLKEVIYIYSPTREGNVLEEVISGFNGVLVSDFYNVYDSANCPQQKCLIHLIRDMNDDLQQNQFVDEYKEMVREFSILIKSIICTIDKYGLKKRHLHKHKREAEKFFKVIVNGEYTSEIALKYQKKFKSYQSKLFAFLDYDGVPWNNNNAENAIKGFAAYRKLANGCFTEKGIKDYLILLSIYQTCNYKEIDFLKFLLSKETDINKFDKS